MDKAIRNSLGFTLVEVMIAVALFGAFITAFSISQSNNVNNSIEMSKSLVLLRLCESKMNEVLLDPPRFTNATDKTAETKNFEIEGYKHFQYTIEFAKMQFPDLASLMGEEEDENRQENNDSLIRKALFKKLKENIEQILWQVRVTVTNTETKESYDLTSWIKNPAAKVDANFSI